MNYCPMTKQECQNPKCIGCKCVKATGEEKEAETCEITPQDWAEVEEEIQDE
jgi:hypothetical protein